MKHEAILLRPLPWLWLCHAAPRLTHGSGATTNLTANAADGALQPEWLRDLPQLHPIRETPSAQAIIKSASLGGCLRNKQQLCSHPPAVLDDGRSVRMAHRGVSATHRAGNINQTFQQRTIDSNKRLQITGDRSARGQLYSDSDDCSTGTPGPMVEETEIFFR